MKTRLAMLFLLLACVAPVFGAADAVYEINQLVKKGKTDQALEQIDAYLAAQPKNAWGRNITQMRFLKGVLLAEKKRTPEAIHVFAKLIQDYPDLPEPYNNLAALYAGQGQFEKARDILERGLRTDPAYATAYRNLNDVYAQLASKAYDRTVQADRQSSPVLIKELCDNYGRVANQAVGRRQTLAGDLSLLHDIPKSRSSAGAPPSKVDIDEMAMDTFEEESPVPPAFNNPGINTTMRAAGSPPKPTEHAEKAEIGKTDPGKLGLETAGLEKPRDAEQAKPEAGDEKAVLSAVEGWAASWSRKDTASYLSFYGKEFHPPGGLSRSEWTQQRRERIGKPKSIKVTVEQPKVTLSDDAHAMVSFRQGYRSDNLQTTTRKTLLMLKTGGKWSIQEERVGG